MVHILSTDRLQVCLVMTEFSTPFISTLELRKLNSTTYNYEEMGSCQTLMRADVGSISNQPLRYGADVFDRIWLPYNFENWSQISTKNSVFTDQRYTSPPETVMATASVPTDPDAPMNIPLALVEPTPIYVIMYFAEIQELSSNDTREMIIMYNGRHWQGPIIPRYLTTTESAFLYVEVGPNKNGEYIFSLQKSANSTLPPLLSAMEVFLPNSLTEQETDKKEVDAMMNIKLGYRLNNRNWQGDPCAPQGYMWDGVNCSYGPPRIISLNLSASDLAGEILDSISHLTNLELLDLSNNSLNGSVPEFLASMHTLKLINLSRNNLNGSVPTSLLDKAKRGSVLLSLDGNLMLCSSASCANTNNKKKFILAASVAASLALIILIAAATLFFLKRKRRAKLGRRPILEKLSVRSQVPASASLLSTCQ